MPSQIKVDEIKNVAGQYEIKTNTFKGQTTGGSIAIQGEGTATTNLQQGLGKVWIKKAANGASILESFNVSSLTDTATGRYTVSINNDMDNANYACSSAITNDNSSVIETCEIRISSPAPATGSFGAENAYVNSSTNRTDNDSISSIIVHGDLA